MPEGNETIESLPDLDDALIAEFQEQVTAKPDMIPTKFGGDFRKYVQSTKSLQTAFTKATQENAELRKQIGSEAKAEDKTVAKPVDAKPVTGAPEAGAGIDLKETPAPAGNILWNEAGQELLKTGELSDATIAKITALGAPREMIDFYVNSFKRERASNRAEAAKMFGGEDKLLAAVDWAKKTLPRAELDVLSNGINSAGWKTILTGLYHSWSKSLPNANAPKDTPGTKVGGTDTGDSGPFKSEEEMSAAIRNPAYRIDPVYRTQVQKRIEQSFQRR